MWVKGQWKNNKDSLVSLENHVTFLLRSLFNQEKTRLMPYHDILSHITIWYNIDILPSPTTVTKQLQKTDKQINKTHTYVINNMVLNSQCPKCYCSNCTFKNRVQVPIVLLHIIQHSVYALCFANTCCKLYPSPVVFIHEHERQLIFNHMTVDF